MQTKSAKYDTGRGLNCLSLKWIAISSVDSIAVRSKLVAVNAILNARILAKQMGLHRELSVRHPRHQWLEGLFSPFATFILTSFVIFPVIFVYLVEDIA